MPSFEPDFKVIRETTDTNVFSEGCKPDGDFASVKPAV